MIKIQNSIHSSEKSSNQRQTDLEVGRELWLKALNALSKDDYSKLDYWMSNKPHLREIVKAA